MRDFSNYPYTFMRDFSNYPYTFMRDFFSYSYTFMRDFLQRPSCVYTSSRGLSRLHSLDVNSSLLHVAIQFLNKYRLFNS